jgi:hypothetical protein
MREIKSVSFCLADNHEQQLFQYAMNQGRFSKYIKRLIERDMYAIQPKKPPQKKVEVSSFV